MISDICYSHGKPTNTLSMPSFLVVTRTATVLGFPLIHHLVSPKIQKVSLIFCWSNLDKYLLLNLHKLQHLVKFHMPIDMSESPEQVSRTRGIILIKLHK